MSLSAGADTPPQLRLFDGSTYVAKTVACIQENGVHGFYRVLLEISMLYIKQKIRSVNQKILDFFSSRFSTTYYKVRTLS